jgi:hypothetical protein
MVGEEQLGEQPVELRALEVPGSGEAPHHPPLEPLVDCAGRCLGQAAGGEGEGELGRAGTAVAPLEASGRVVADVEARIEKVPGAVRRLASTIAPAEVRRPR